MINYILDTLLIFFGVLILILIGFQAYKQFLINRIIKNMEHLMDNIHTFDMRTLVRFETTVNSLDGAIDAKYITRAKFLIKIRKGILNVKEK